MELTIESTDVIASIDGVPVRLWRGRTDAGEPVDVYVHRIATASPAAQLELAMSLEEQGPPVAPAAHTLDYAQVERMTRDRVERNRGVRREDPAQAAVDRAAEAALDAGYVHLASALLMLSTCQITHRAHLANQALLQCFIDGKGEMAGD